MHAVAFADLLLAVGVGVREEVFETDEDVSVATLLDRYRQGDDSAATELYERYAPRLYAATAYRLRRYLASRVDTEDILQSVFRSFFSRVADGQYLVESDQELWKLLFVITLNKIRSAGAHHRAHKRNVFNSDNAEELEMTPCRHDEAALSFQELRLLVGELLERLPKFHQEIVKLRLEGYKVNEITEATHCAKRTVERILQDFRRELKARLE